MKLMIKISHYFWGLALFIVSSALYAAPPPNLADVKKQLIEYHRSGQYERDIEAVINDAISYLKVTLANKKLNGKKPAIVLDIDETALSNFPAMRKLSFGGTLKHIQDHEKMAKSPVINPTLRLYSFAKANRLAVFFISGRPKGECSATITNLRRVGYSSWHGIYLRPEKYLSDSAAAFKIAMRKRLVEQGYTIVANIGDQYSDLRGGYAEKTFKLPNPFYIIH